MVEYVYARHDFVPEHEDEISFRAGERIEVVEKDEQYEDGWWQGRNLAGKVGLFPESYTQPAPPTSEPPPAAIPASLPPAPAPADSAPSSPPSLLIPEPESLQSLHEDTSPSITNGDAHPNHTTTKSNGEVMRATMTDVQKAIEQLGHKDDFDGSRSFTFSSTRGESTDHDTDTDADGEDWHKTARQKLAENAKMAAEEQAARESAEIRAPIRSAVPPIDVEMSDDSGDEDDAPSNGHLRRHSHIPEEEEEDTAPPHPPVNGRRFSDSSSIQPSESYIVPSPAVRPGSDFAEDTATEAGASTATQSSFPLPPERNTFLPTPVSPDRRGISKGISTNGTDAASHPSSAQLLFPSKMQTLTLKEAAGVLPSPAASTTGHRHGYSFGSATSSTRATAASPLLLGIRTTDQRPRHVHPADWSVEEVIDWLRSKGFDEDSCKKFAEQEITGDVLLDLDVNVLKSEIGIMAYGKRMRIANAITELRRPPSVMSSSADQPTRPGSYSQGTPFPLLGAAQNSSSLDTAGQSLASPDSSPDSGLAAVTPDSAHQNSDSGVRTSLDQVNNSSATIGLGLGIPASLLPGVAQGKSVKGRPTKLSLSPSDGALGANAKVVAVEQEEEEERVVLSDSDTKNFTTKSRGQLFGRQNSTSSTGKLPSSRISKEVTTPRSDTSQLSEGSRPRHERRKRSLDANRENSRLSIFGSTFVGTLGKSRKPPPRYSSAVDEASSERNPLSLSRLYHSGSRKSSTRLSPADSHTALNAKEDKKREKREKRESKDSGASKDKKDPSLLRKRTPSATDAPLRTSPESSTLKPGQNILAQIGTPDHNGWMRKKGEHYNTWKNRYFVLKGPHLYWLKSNAQSETKIKGYVNIVGYRIISDENVDPGRYGFKLSHETDRIYCFSSDEQVVIREWMKALMKATIDRDYTKPVVSSVNVPTIPLAVAQAMNPAPRPPSPTARAATQRAMRRENTNQLSTRDAEILMGMPAASPPQSANGRPRVESFFNELEAVGPSSQSTSPMMQAPPVRPPRELRKKGSMSEHPSLDPDLIEWANSHLPSTLQLDSKGSICGGLELLRIAESIKGLRSSSVPDSAFPRGRGRGNDDDKLEGLFTLFDFLLDNDVKMGTVSINDVRQGKRDKIIQLLKALRAWDDKRKMILQSIGEGSMQAGPFIVPV
ncbi:hypothetical protein EDB92DRAFT_1916615 [Lactarius akahatsu]|uniref:Uncharacterized protein n=1 Tax=Lactarius akahatsu TaxID=416441 RepID=A0AAD4Q772_9AGAM|nr:hypothetical protein EDB92DRAFT_1916615 [Lactarius akahatsu]